jgi:hypothetical protein
MLDQIMRRSAILFGEIEGKDPSTPSGVAIPPDGEAYERHRWFSSFDSGGR